MTDDQTIIQLYWERNEEALVERLKNTVHSADQ